MDVPAKAIVELHEWAAAEVAEGRSPEDVHAQLLNVSDRVLDEFRTSFDVPDVRYYEISHPQSWFTGFGRRRGSLPSEVSRSEFLCRQGLFGRPDDEERL